MRGRGAAKSKKFDRAAASGRSFASHLLVFLAVLALLSQWFAPALHAMETSRDPAGAAAELRATFGDLAVLCVQAEDAKSPLGPSDPRGHCEDCCPLCQAIFGLHVLLPWASLGAPERMEGSAEIIASAREFGRPPPRRTPLAQPRAPPFDA